MTTTYYAVQTQQTGAPRTVLFTTEAEALAHEAEERAAGTPQHPVHAVTFRLSLEESA